MSKRKILRTSIIATVLVVFFLLVMFFAPLSTTKAFDASEYNYDLKYTAELDGMSVMSQRTEYTCFVVSMAIVRNYLGLETTEDGLRNELNVMDRNEGMMPGEYTSYFNKALEPLSYSASLVNPKSQAEILNVIIQSLMNGLPVVFLYSAMDDWNKPNYNTHYGVIYGIDMRKEIIKISNPYGYLQEIAFADMFEGLSFQSYESEPFMFRLGRKTGIIKENNLFVLEKTV